MYLAVVSFRSSILELSLYPDSRGYVLFRLLTHASPNGKEEWDETKISDLTCDYLPDVVEVNRQAAVWIMTNCEEITEKGQHLYWKFPQELIDAFLSLKETDVSGLISAVLCEV